MQDADTIRAMDAPTAFPVEIAHRWLVKRRTCDPEWVERDLALMGRRPLRPLWRGVPMDGGTALASAALTLLPLEHWDASMIPFIRSAGLSDIPLPQRCNPPLRDEALANGWTDWPNLIASRGISRSPSSFSWCLEFVRQLQPPGLDLEAAAIADGWFALKNRRMPSPMEILSIRIREEAACATTTKEVACLDAEERTFMAISSKFPLLNWTPEMLLSLVPEMLLRTSFQSACLPKRVLNCMQHFGARTWRDLLSYDPGALMKIPNFGETSLTAIRAAIRPAVLAMASERAKSSIPILDRIKEWISQFQEGDGRHAQILGLRLGLERIDGDIPTLEELGSRFGVTRERIRQIEKMAWGAMLTTMPALSSAGEGLSRRLREQHGLLPVDELRQDRLIGSLASAQGTIAALVNLGWVPGARIWKNDDRMYLSLLEDGRTTALLRALRDSIAKCDGDIDLTEWSATYEATGKIDCEMAMKHVRAAFGIPDGQRFVKARRGNRIRSDILGMLEASPVPMHFRDVANRIKDDEWDPEDARVQVMLNSIPGVMLLSMGCYGTKRHFPEMDTVAPDVIQAALEIMTSGEHDLERDWAMHALSPMVNELADPPCGLDAYRLHAILCSRPDLFIDTGRLTIRLNLSHGGQDADPGVDRKPAARRQRHLLAIEILEAAGGPMDASALGERIRQQRDIKDVRELAAQYSDLLVMLHDDRIGLVPRDLPGDPGARACVADAVADILVNRGWSIGLDVAVGTMPIPKLIPAIQPEGLRAILLQDDRFLKRPYGMRAALSSWGDERTAPPPETLLELAETLEEGFTTKQMQASVQEVFGEAPGSQAIVRILRGTMRWMQTPSGQWLRTPQTSP